MNTTRCKLCGSTDHTLIRDTLRHDIKRNVLRCKKCSFVFLEPKQAGSGDYYSGKEYRAKYGPVLKKASSPQEIFDIYFPYQYRIIDEFRKILRPNMKVLDVGCSTGHLLAALKGKVKTRVGVELSTAEAEFVRSSQKIKVYSEPIESVVIPEGPFDLVISSRVLEHVPDPLLFLQSIKKHLKPGGHAYIEVPNLDDALLSVFEVAGYANFYYREPHLSYFSPKTFGMFLKKAGYHGKVVTAQRYNFPNALNWIQTGAPQGNFTIGNRIPTFAPDAKDHAKARKELNAFIQKADRDYKAILWKHNLGEALFFFGKVKK